MSVTTFTADESKAISEKITWIRMVCLPGGAIGIAALAYDWPSAHIGWTLFWWFMTAYFMFCWTSCFHECAHQTLHSSKGLSIWLGRILGTVIFVPYSCYRESHIRHHAYLNKPSDFELWPYSDPNCSVAFRRAFAWFDLFVGPISAAITYGRIYWAKSSPLKEPALRRVIRNEYLFIFLVWGSLFTVLSIYGWWWMFFKVWAIPVWLAGLYQTGRKFTEHLGMSSYDPMLGTRTVLGHNWFTRMCTFLNFDIFVHGPHHRHPRVAHNVLGKKMQEYIEAHPDKPFPLYRTYWQATREMIPYFFKNPGVGMNAGAAAPGKDKDDDVQNFVRDVSIEVLHDNDRLVDAIDKSSLDDGIDWSSK